MILLLVRSQLCHDSLNFILHAIWFLNSTFLDWLLLLSLFSCQKIRITNSLSLSHRAVVSNSWNICKVADWSRDADRLRKLFLVLFNEHRFIKVAFILLTILRNEQLVSFKLADAVISWKSLVLKVSAHPFLCLHSSLFGRCSSSKGVLLINCFFHGLSNDSLNFGILNVLDLVHPRLSHLQVAFLGFEFFSWKFVGNSGDGTDLSGGSSGFI